MMASSVNQYPEVRESPLAKKCDPGCWNSGQCLMKWQGHGAGTLRAPAGAYEALWPFATLPACTCPRSLSRAQLLETLWTVAHQASLSMRFSRQYSPRTLEWVAMPSSRGSSQPRGQAQGSRIASRFFTVWATREAQASPYSLSISLSILPEVLYVNLCYLHPNDPRLKYEILRS